MPGWVNEIWDWFWYFRKGKIRYRVLDYGDTYCASAGNGNITVFNCYGGTKEQAKEMALYRLKKAITKIEEEQNEH